MPLEEVGLEGFGGVVGGGGAGYLGGFAENAPDGRRLGVESGSGCRHGQDVWTRVFVCLDSSDESRMYI